MTGDHGALHLEGRYNYEAIDAGSVWVGWNLDFGSPLAFDVTPMIGGVFGSLNGVAPGLELTVSYRKLELYSGTTHGFTNPNGPSEERADREYKIAMTRFLKEVFSE